MKNLKFFIREVLYSQISTKTKQPSFLREYVEAKCPSCGLQMPKGKKFCKECGTKLGECPSCNSPLNDKENQKFCVKCGEKIPGAFIQNQDSSESKNKQQQSIEKLEDVLQSSQEAWELTKKKSDASQQFSAAMSYYHKAQAELLSAYQSNSKEKIEAAKGKYALAKDKFLSASDEDEKSFSTWLAHMEKTGAPIPPGMKEAQRKMRDDTKQGTEETDKLLSQFDSLAKKAESKLQDADLIKKLKFTGDEKKDASNLSRFLKKSKSIDNKMYLAFVVGHFRKHKPDISFSLRDAWRESDKTGDEISNETLNSILDKAGGAADIFKK